MPRMYLEGGVLFATLDGAVKDPNQWLPSPQFVQEHVAEDWASKKGLRSLDWVGKPANLPPAGVDNLVMSYDEGTIPAFLAGRGSSEQGFDLDRSFDKDHPERGINQNGLYFFSSMRLEGCSSEDWQFDLAEAHSHWELGEGRDVSGNGSFWLYMPSLFADLSVNVVCTETGYRQNGIRIPAQRIYHATTEVAAWAEEPQTTFAFDPTSGSASYSFTGTTVGTHAGESFLDLRELVEGNLGSLVVRTLDGFVLPHWEEGIRGQSGQLHERIREVLDDFYGEGGWQNNPEARIDIVAHSQGGVVVREMVRGVLAESEVDPLDPISKIGHVVTLGTPHLGSAVVTDAQLIQQGHPDPTALDEMERFGALGRNKAQFISDEYHLLATGTVPLALPTPVRFGLHMAVAGHPYLQGAVDALENLPNLEVQLYNKGLIRGFRAEGTLAGFEVFDKSFDIGDATTRLDAIFQASHLAWSEESPFIERLRDAHFPMRPDGSMLSITTLRSNRTGSILRVLMENAPSVLSEDFCIEAIARQKLGYWPRTMLESVMGPLDALCSGGLPGILQRNGFADDWILMSQEVGRFDDGWSEKGDFVVEASSQQGADIWGRHKEWVDGPTLPNPLIPGRYLPRNEFFASRRFAMENVAHGTLELPDWGNIDGVCRTRPGEHLMYLDVWEALQHPPLPGREPPGTSIAYGARDWCRLEEKMAAGVPGTYDGAVLNAEHSGDFDLHSNLETQGTLLAARSLSVTALTGDRISIHQSASTGTILDVCHNSECEPSYVFSPDMAEEVRLRRSGDAWLAAARFGNSWLEKSFQAQLPQAVRSQRITARRGAWELTGRPSLWGNLGRTDLPVDPVAALRVEVRDPQPQANLSRLEVRMVNTSDRPVEGWNLTFWFHADSGRHPILEQYWMAGATASLEKVQDAWYRVRVTGADVLPAGGTFPSGDALQLGVHDSDWSPWALVGPGESPSSDWAEWKGVVLSDAHGRIVSGSVPNLDRLAYRIGPDLKVESFDASNGDPNLSSVRVRIRNEGNGGLGAFVARYWFDAPLDREPVVEPYSLPTGCRVGLSSPSQGSWTADLTCDHLFAGAEQEFQFGLHDRQWRSWDRSLELSANGSTTWASNEAIFVELSDGFRLHGRWDALRAPGSSVEPFDPSGPSDPSDPGTGTNELEVLGQRLEYGNQTHVRLAVRNQGDQVVDGFRLRYDLASATADPELETPSLAGCEAHLETNSEPHSVVLDCSRVQVAPGKVFPDPAGTLFWFHWTDWSPISGSTHGSQLDATMQPVSTVTLLSGGAP
ncbi:MAG: hypothetical protein H6686_12620 [Fibrobacteria bacterium]|nr:hypothetical protein [Fibrobacteria bacterium]